MQSVMGKEVIMTKPILLFYAITHVPNILIPYW